MRSEWQLVWRLGLTFALLAGIALERARQKGAGLRTHISTRRLVSGEGGDAGTVSVRLELHGTNDLDALAVDRSALDGVLAVDVDDPGDS